MSRNKTFLCRCEDVTLHEFREAYAEGFTEIESLKRYTGVATGFCQGKGCLAESALELARLREADPRGMRPTTIRPPAEPLTFAQLASLDVPEAEGAPADADADAPAGPGGDDDQAAADAIDKETP